MIWHYQPDPSKHRTACGRVDNVRAPFAMTDDVRDITCSRCLRCHVTQQAQGHES